MYCLNMLRIALELSQHDTAYESIASKFFEHFLAIAEAMNHVGCRAIEEGGIGMWDDETEWYTSLASFPDGHAMRMQSFSMVNLIPLFAVETLEPEELARMPEFAGRLEWLVKHRKDLAHLVAEWTLPGVGQRRLAALMRGHRMKRVLSRMLDETQFLSDYGVRSLSKYHHESDRVALRRSGFPSRLRAGRIGRRHVRRQLQLARPDLVPRQLSDHRIAAKIPSLLRRRFQNRMPHRLRKIPHAVGSGR